MSNPLRVSHRISAWWGWGSHSGGRECLADQDVNITVGFFFFFGCELETGALLRMLMPQPHHKTIDSEFFLRLFI